MESSKLCIIKFQIRYKETNVEKKAENAYLYRWIFMPKQLAKRCRLLTVSTSMRKENTL